MKTANSVIKTFDRSSPVEAYWTWRGDHDRNGYVINTYQETSERYVKLHRASCRTMKSYKRYGKRGATKGQYKKICSASVESLIAHVSEVVPAEKIRLCSTCMPLEDFDERASPGGEDLDVEGRRKLRSHFETERSAKNRKLALKGRAKPYVCDACERSLAAYGSTFGDLIEVHHVVPVSKGEQKPSKEQLLVLCPNCHAIAHWKRGNEPLGLEELRAAARALRARKSA